jgi:cysteine synthase A
MRVREATGLRVGDDITQLVGGTPMLRLGRIVPPDAAAVFAKLEYLNPGGSVKDRAATGIIRRAEQQQLIRQGGTIIEATAGNTGIGLALIGIKRGYKVVLFVPQRFSKEKVMLMRALGAEVIRTPDDEGMEGAIRRARELAARTPNSLLAGQFENQANPDYHYETTAPEIFEQMEGQLDAIVLGAGTGGTFTGVARFMKERIPHLIAVAVESQGSVLGGGKSGGEHMVEGIGASFLPATFDPGLADQVVMVYDSDAFATVKRLAAEEGVLAGSSGGAAAFAALQLARRLGPGKRVVTLIPDSAERYLSKDIFGMEGQ